MGATGLPSPTTPSWNSIPLERVDYDSRRERARYAATRFGEYLRSPILDVGCWEKDLQEFCGGAEYLGIDVAGSADVKVDLESGKLPFADASFNTVVCTDVLEHLDNLHAVCEEIVRVSSRYMIISLPNSWRVLRKRIIRGEGRPKQYGLPFERPEDRHKWFFSATDAISFLWAMAAHHSLQMPELVGSLPLLDGRPKELLRERICRAVLKPKRFLNRHTVAVWCVMSKGL